MASIRKRDEPPSTKPGHRVGAATARARAIPPPREDVDDRQRRSEAPTLPPPAPTTKRSGIRSKRKSLPNAATVDEVVADLSQDPRREEEE